MNTQDELFVAAEADQWFERNRAALLEADLTKDLPLKVISLYQLAPRTVLEVGASNGYRVAELSKRTGAKVVAVEPSLRAVEDGRSRYPHVTFHQGQARELPVDGPFDLVIVNGVFCLIDRANLLSCAAELDRVTADNGYLLIGDFLPGVPKRVRYHHLPDHDVHTYKQDYAEIFLASRLYQPVALLSSTSGYDLVADSADDARVAVRLLRKRPADGYAAASRPEPQR